MNVKKGEQKHADFVALNPNGKVPVLRDDERGFTLCESAAILVYLAERHGALLAQEPVTRARTFVAGDDFSIADIAHFGWIWRRTFPDLTLDDAPNVQRWRRVAISNQRLVAFDERGVTFRCKDYRAKGQF